MSHSAIPKATPTDETLRMKRPRVHPRPRLARPRVVAAGATDTGSVASENEDRFAIVELSRLVQLRGASDTTRTQGVQDSAVQGTLLAVADGIGGHRGGSLASSLALDAFIGYVAYEMPWLSSVRGADPSAVLQESLVAALEACEAELRAVAEREQMQPYRPGTTLTAAYVAWPAMCVFHVGDSRCYLLRDGTLIRATRDHTLAQVMIEGGTDPDEVPGPFHRVLCNSIGGSDEPIRPDVERFGLLPTDTVILCTDGISDQVDDDEIAKIVTSATSAQEASEMLVARASDAGGCDNATAVVARFAEAWLQ